MVALTGATALAQQTSQVAFSIGKRGNTRCDDHREDRITGQCKPFRRRAPSVTI
jgi:hypothetical protein